ncbi:MAG: alkaline phosphatase D family protein [Bacteroidota bacterium]
MKKIVTLLALLFIAGTAFTQKPPKPKLLTGPLVGSVTKNSAKIWIAYRGKGQNVLILGDTADKQVYYPTNVHYITNSRGDVALTMDFTGLKPDHSYNIIISIDGWGTNVKHSFKTQADTAVKDFNFLLGSCALMMPGVARTVFPAASTMIFHHMKKRKSDFMVWLGDDVYYFKKDYSSYDGMFNLNLKTRRTFHLYREFLSSQPHYAIWDDHDYGPDNCCETFPLRDSSLKVFKGMWPNTYPEGEQFYGNYFNFRYYDAEFFMTDARFYRSPEGDTAGAFLGETQLVWLKNKLLMSDASFKFIAIGSQVLNDNNFGESYADYPRERNELLDFIADNNIKGVMFLTGDKHYSELSKRVWKGYPLYDFTCSPLTFPALPRRLLGAYKNTYRVGHFDFGRRNFGRISFSGPKGDRLMKLEIIDRSGYKKREIVLNENDLMRK